MRSLSLSLALAIAIAVVPAYAQSPADDAHALAAKGDYLAAAAKFRAAFEADPRPELMCNVGVAYNKARDLPRAHRYLTQCLTIGTALDRTFLDGVKAVVADLETKLHAGEYTPVDLVVSPPHATIEVAGGAVFDEPLVGSRRVWFPFGGYTLTIRAEGYVDQTLALAATSHDATPGRVVLERAAVVTPTPITAPPPIGSSHVARSKTPAVVIAVASGVLAISAGGMYLMARKRIDQAEDELERPAFNDRVDAAHTWRFTSVVTLGVAGAGGLMSVLLWRRASRPIPQIEVDATGGGASVSIRGAW